MSDVEVRVATAADLPTVAEFRWAVDTQAEQPDVSHNDFVADFVEWVASHPQYHCVMALAGDRMIGVAWLAVLPRIPGPHRFDRAGGDVQSVYVLDEYRNCGVGTDIMRRVIELARELGLRRVTVQSSRRAIPLYNRAGFGLKEYLLGLDLG